MTEEIDILMIVIVTDMMVGIESVSGTEMTEIVSDRTMIDEVMMTDVVTMGAGDIK